MSPHGISRCSNPHYIPANFRWILYFLFFMNYAKFWHGYEIYSWNTLLYIVLEKYQNEDGYDDKKN